MLSDQLYMTVAEQKSDLDSAGYAPIRQALLTGGMVLRRATAP